MNYFKIFNLFLLIAVLCISCGKDDIESTTANSILSNIAKKNGSNYEQNLKSFQTLVNKKWTVKDVKIENGMMSFNDENELYSFIVFLNKQKDVNAWLNNFEKETGFESLRSHYVNQLDYLNEVLDKNDDDFAEDFLYKFVNSNSNYWFIDESDSENRTLTQTYEFSSFYLVANKNLKYKVAGKLKTVDKNEGNQNVQYSHDSKNLLRTEGVCGLPHQEVEDVFTKDERWCGRDRRVKLRTVVMLGDQNDFFAEAGYNTHVKGQRKRACIWANYRTDLEFKNSTAVLNVRMPDGTLLQNIVPGALTKPDASVTNENSFFRSTFSFYLKPNGQTDDVRIETDIKFSKVAAEGSSRGIGGSWAVIDCDEDA